MLLSQVITLRYFFLDVLNDLRMHVLQGSLLLDLPSPEDVIAVRIPIACNLLIRPHKLQSIL